MLVLTDTAFERHGVDRHNRDRVAIERQSQSSRRGQPIRSNRVDGKRPAFDLPSPSLGGGGALDPVSGLLILAGGAAAWSARRRGMRAAGADAEERS
jgi:MprA protease rhombosortase-interaction domain-containing protein